MTAAERVKLRAWYAIADLMGLGPITFRPLNDGWSATAGRHRAEGATGLDALSSLCRKASVAR